MLALFLVLCLVFFFFFCTVSLWTENGTPRKAVCFAMHGMVILLFFILFFMPILVHVLIYFAVTDKMLGQYATSRHLVESLSPGMAPGRGGSRTAQQQEWRLYHSSRHPVPHQHDVGSSHHKHYLGRQVFFFFFFSGHFSWIFLFWWWIVL